jgi:hypothetical protein
MTALLDSITDTLTLTECAYINDFEVRLRAMTDITKDKKLEGP